ncbi:hypothetical protein F2P81_016018 [Scophthalmus maximus]|uniref:Uncharacterized protein n=1 Tax=Scophthalmus maximus TaxID=52904 RepID=A0A6A4SBC2_SCOMX|nr:hypothetical protein F2P81_016018 [Scophthalmus maximus]
MACLRDLLICVVWCAQAQRGVSSVDPPRRGRLAHDLRGEGQQCSVDCTSWSPGSSPVRGGRSDDCGGPEMHATREESRERYLSSVAARLTVIDYPDATLLWIYCQRHSRRLNDNDPDKQLQSLFAARTQRMSAGNDSEGDMLNALPQVSASNSLYVHTEDCTCSRVVFMSIYDCKEEIIDENLSITSLALVVEKSALMESEAEVRSLKLPTPDNYHKYFNFL